MNSNQHKVHTKCTFSSDILNKWINKCPILCRCLYMIVYLVDLHTQKASLNFGKLRQERITQYQIPLLCSKILWMMMSVIRSGSCWPLSFYWTHLSSCLMGHETLQLNHSKWTGKSTAINSFNAVISIKNQCGHFHQAYGVSPELLETLMEMLGNLPLIKHPSTPFWRTCPWGTFCLEILMHPSQVNT
jgi:hypothetical protein